MLLSLILALPLVTAATLDKRATCTVTSNKDASKSDVPAITAALNSCGAGGVIVLSKGTIYAINEVLDISACKSCEIQLEGIAY